MNLCYEMLKYQEIQVTAGNKFEADNSDLFSIQIGEDACVFPVVEHCNRLFRNKSG